MKAVAQNKSYVWPIEESFKIFQSQNLSKMRVVIMVKPARIIRLRTIWAASILAATTIGNVQPAMAALVSPCSGVSLPKSVVTDIVGAAVLPITSTLDGGLLLLLGPLGLNSNLTTTLGGIAAGAPINLNVLDTSGNIVSPADQCQAITDAYTLNTPKGISIGGNQITGLGNGLAANAGELNSIAFGNGSVTDTAAINSMAIGQMLLSVR